MSVVGSIAVNVVARTAAFVEGMKKSKKELRSFEHAVKGTQKVVSTATSLAGTIASASFVQSIQHAANQLDELGKTADRIGVTTEALAGLQHGAGLAGIESTVLDKSMQGLARRLSEAATGTGEAVGVIADLKMNAAELNRLSPDKALGRIADEMNKLANQSDKVRVATKLFGEEGVKMLNFMQEGSAGIEKYRKEAEKLGLAISREDIAKVEQMNDAMTRLGKAWDGVKGEITINIAPAATEALDTLRQWVSLQHRGSGLVSSVERAQRDRDAATSMNPLDVVGSTMRRIEDYLIGQQLKRERPTAPADLQGAAGTARFGLRNPFTPEQADMLVGQGNARDQRRENALKAFQAWASGTTKSPMRQLFDKFSESTERLFRADAPGSLGQALMGQDGVFDKLRGLKNQARGFGLQFQLDYMIKKFMGRGGGDPVMGKSSMPMGGNEIVERGTQAAYQASKASDHVAKILREQLIISKQGIEYQRQIAMNTGGGDVFSMGTA